MTADLSVSTANVHFAIKYIWPDCGRRFCFHQEANSKLTSQCGFGLCPRYRNPEPTGLKLHCIPQMVEQRLKIKSKLFGKSTCVYVLGEGRNQAGTMTRILPKSNCQLDGARIVGILSK